MPFILKEKDELSFDSINFNINPFINQISEIEHNNFVSKDVNDELVLKEKEKAYQFNSISIEIKNNTSINKEQLSSISKKDLKYNRIKLNNIYMKNNMNLNNSNNIINYNNNEIFGFIKSLNKNIYNNKHKSRYIDNNSTLNNYNENSFNNNEKNLKHNRIKLNNIYEK